MAPHAQVPREEELVRPDGIVSTAGPETDGRSRRAGRLRARRAGASQEPQGSVAGDYGHSPLAARSRYAGVQAVPATGGRGVPRSVAGSVDQSRGPDAVEGAGSQVARVAQGLFEPEAHRVGR